MTDLELLGIPLCSPVLVTATDYQYEGWLNAVFSKRSGKIRCVVEDERGRLFVHNAGQLSRRQ
jgi:hypothetical protein